MTNSFSKRLDRLEEKMTPGLVVHCCPSSRGADRARGKTCGEEFCACEADRSDWFRASRGRGTYIELSYMEGQL